MKKKTISLVSILILVILFSTGCTDLLKLDSKTIYEAHPTKISYTISYGYEVNISGSGEYNLVYDCDEPEVLKGIVSTVISENIDYTLRTIATYNQMRSWNITSSVTKDYDLGITATVICESFIVSDISGKHALTVEELRNRHPDIVDRYTNAQSKDDTVYINPLNPEIINIVDLINESNSFIYAKKLFIWLKQNTVYKIHNNNEVQTSDYTLTSRSGDCDDLSFLYIALCRAAGIPARFIRGFLLVDSNPIAHAWAEVFVGGGVGNDGWVPVECAGTSSFIDVEVHQNFGVENCEHLRVFKDDGTDESLQISLLGFYSKYDVTRNVKPEPYAKVTDYLILDSSKLVIDNEKDTRYYS